MQRQTPSSLLLIAAIAGGIGFVAFVALMVVGGFTVSPAVFLAIVVAVAAAVVLFLGFHKGPDREMPQTRPSDDGRLGNVTREAGTAGVAPGSAGVVPGEGAMHSPAASDDISESHAGATEEEAVGRAGATAAPAGAAASGALAGTAPKPTGVADATAETAEEARWRSSQLEGQTELSERKGEWKYENNSEEAAPIAAEPTSEVETATPEPSTVPEPDAEPTSEVETAQPEPAPQASAPATQGDDAPKWKSSQLAGQTELSSRKGSWKYEAGPKTSPETVTTPDETVGHAPSRLDAPRGDGPDDLKRIKGVGPKLEEMLHGMGIYHFDQIAGWSDEELAWVDEHLEGFKGRASRDAWVSQAQDLNGS